MTLTPDPDETTFPSAEAAAEAHRADHDFIYEALKGFDLEGGTVAERLDAADSATSEPIYVPARTFGISWGSPTESTVGSNRGFVWSLPGGADSRISTEMKFPSTWSTVDILLHWYNLGTDTNPVAWTLRAEYIADGEDGSPIPNDLVASADVAAGLQNVRKVSQIGTGVAIPAAVGFGAVSLYLLRPNTSADTHSEAVGFAGVEFVKAS